MGKVRTRRREGFLRKRIEKYGNILESDHEFRFLRECGVSQMCCKGWSHGGACGNQGDQGR